MAAGREAVLAEALRIVEDDERVNRAIGRHGADWILARAPAPVRVLTHCNTGALATVAWGTALGIVRELHARGALGMVYVDETRPLLQGARLTAWELERDGIPHLVQVDGAAASTILRRLVDVAIFGADRIAANGDTANKIGSLGVALACRDAGIPCMVAAPVSTVDLATASGDAIEIELRGEAEVLAVGRGPRRARGLPRLQPGLRRDAGAPRVGPGHRRRRARGRRRADAGRPLLRRRALSPAGRGSRAVAGGRRWRALAERAHHVAMRNGRARLWVLAVAIAFASLGLGGGAAAGERVGGHPVRPGRDGSARPRSPPGVAAWTSTGPGVFTTQRTWLWCTAADIQISRNIVFHRADHTTAGQRAYFTWMRAHNRYALPLSAGVDAAGWAAGFRHFVDGRYQLVASTTFDAALRSAVTRLRRTSLPVGITVDHGNHAWLITGFTATADPATTTRFTVTSVRVVGPLYGLQSRNGYDMPPDTRLTPAQLRRFFTPWRYAPSAWSGTGGTSRSSRSRLPRPRRPPPPRPCLGRPRLRRSRPATAPSPSDLADDNLRVDHGPLAGDRCDLRVHTAGSGRSDSSGVGGDDACRRRREQRATGSGRLRGQRAGDGRRAACSFRPRWSPWGSLARSVLAVRRRNGHQPR